MLEIWGVDLGRGRLWGAEKGINMINKETLLGLMNIKPLNCLHGGGQIKVIEVGRERKPNHCLLLMFP